MTNALKSDTFKPDMDVYKIMGLINDLINGKFYGEFLLKFESGHVVIIKKTETIKI